MTADRGSFLGRGSSGQTPQRFVKRCEGKGAGGASGRRGRARWRWREARVRVGGRKRSVSVGAARSTTRLLVLVGLGRRPPARIGLSARRLSRFHVRIGLAGRQRGGSTSASSETPGMPLARGRSGGLDGTGGRSSVRNADLGADGQGRGRGRVPRRGVRTAGGRRGHWGNLHMEGAFGAPVGSIGGRRDESQLPPGAAVRDLPAIRDAVSMTLATRSLSSPLFSPSVVTPAAMRPLRILPAGAEGRVAPAGHVRSLPGTAAAGPGPGSARSSITVHSFSSTSFRERSCRSLPPRVPTWGDAVAAARPPVLRRRVGGLVGDLGLRTDFDLLYSLGDVLGEGSFGTVRRAHDRVTGE